LISTIGVARIYDWGTGDLVSQMPMLIDKFTKVMDIDGNCKYLPMFSLSYVKYAFGYGFWLY